MFMSDGDSYTVKDVLDYLSKIEINNLHMTYHFNLRADERKSDISRCKWSSKYYPQ